MIRFFTLCLVFLFSTGLEAKHPRRKPTQATYAKGICLVVSSTPIHGMFSLFIPLLGALHYYDQGVYRGVKIDFNQGPYLDFKVGPNWWDYYFEPLHLGSGKRWIADGASIGRLVGVGYEIGKERAHQLIQKYVRIRPHIQEKLQDFVQNQFEDAYVIGVHYRGTDKVTENPLVSYQTVFNAIRQTIEALSPLQKDQCKIFVATDEQPFLDAIRSEFTCPVICRDIIRSTDGKPVHFNYYTSNYQKGEDALLDCLLLSKSHFLIRVPSHLSLCVEMFNPKMPVLLLK